MLSMSGLISTFLGVPPLTLRASGEGCAGEDGF